MADKPAETEFAAIDIARLLRRAGLRATSARRLIWTRLAETGRPMSHLELSASLPEVERSTVYRTLRDFCYCGLAKRSDLGDGVWRYETVGVTASTSNCRFVCNQCGLIEHLDEVRIELPEIEIVGVVFKGRCQECIRQASGAKTD